MNKSTSDWKPTSFNETLEHLPAGYSGLDAKQFHKLFKEKVGKITKSEYETQESFAKRTADLDSLLEPITTSDLYAFRVYDVNFNDITFSYNAETQSYQVDTSPYFYMCHPVFPWATCKISKITRKSSSFRGSNAFGVSATVRKTYGLDFALAIPRDSLFLKEAFRNAEYEDSDGRNQRGYTFEDKFPVSVTKARSINKKDIGVLFVGRVTNAMIIEGKATLKDATINSPSDLFIQEEAIPFDIQEIVYYVVKTGEILHKHTFQ